MATLQERGELIRAKLAKYPFLNRYSYFNVKDSKEEIYRKVSDALSIMNQAELQDPEIGGLFLYEVTALSQETSEAVQLLIQAGCSLKGSCPVVRHNALNRSFYYGKIETARLLIGTGEFDLFDKTASPPIRSLVTSAWVTSEHGKRSELLKDICLMFPHEIRSWRACDRGDTLLHQAGTPEVVRELLHAGIDPSIKNNKGETAKEWWIWWRDYILKTYGRRGADHVRSYNRLISALDALVGLRAYL